MRVAGISREGIARARLRRDLPRPAWASRCAPILEAEQVDAIVHAALDTGPDAYRINVEGTTRWLDEADAAGVPLQILLSTLSAAPERPVGLRPGQVRSWRERFIDARADRVSDGRGRGWRHVRPDAALHPALPGRADVGRWPPTGLRARDRLPVRGPAMRTAWPVARGLTGRALEPPATATEYTLREHNGSYRGRPRVPAPPADGPAAAGPGAAARALEKLPLPSLPITSTNVKGLMQGEGARRPHRTLPTLVILKPSLDVLVAAWGRFAFRENDGLRKEIAVKTPKTMKALVKKDAEPGLWLEEVPVPRSASTTC